MIRRAGYDSNWLTKGCLLRCDNSDPPDTTDHGSAAAADREEGSCRLHTRGLEKNTKGRIPMGSVDPWNLGVVCRSGWGTDAAAAGATGLRSIETAGELRDELLEAGVLGAIQVELIAPGRDRDW